MRRLVLAFAVALFVGSAPAHIPPVHAETGMEPVEQWVQICKTITVMTDASLKDILAGKDKWNHFQTTLLPLTQMFGGLHCHVLWQRIIENNR